MTERPRKARASKRQLRATALIAGGVAFAAPFTALAVAPKPDTSGATAAAARRPVRVVRRVTRRIVIVHPTTPKPSITYVSAPSSSSSTSSSSSAPASTASSTGGS
jgi:hypothetical protein